MAKETVKVDNNLEQIKLEKNDKIEKKNKNNKPKDKKKTENKNDKKSFFTKVREEMRLVTWPTKKEVFKYSIASILMIVLLAAFFIGMSALFDLLYGLVQGWIG